MVVVVRHNHIVVPSRAALQCVIVKNMSFKYKLIAVLWLGFITSIAQISLASEPIRPTHWDFGGKIVEVNHAAKIIKVETPVDKTRNKVVALAVVPHTLLSREFEITASHLHIGDNLHWFGNSKYGISLDRGKPGTVVSLNPVTIKLQGWSSASSLYPNPPIEGLLNTSRKATFGDFGSLIMENPELTLSAMSAKQPGILVVQEEKGAVFGFYSRVWFSDFAIGQSVMAVVSLMPKGQTMRISITTKPKA